ncbi:uncharacterized protein LOC110068354 [Orbicella faveolata]|uniref:uncharacterized protein LOC110068354 n=1 Tax=Orbicella faveolata TaxID=48498 RepID=UPI0009E1F9BC|nr:uncharacterized protein LOC110068354 [Orbicella faveolata]
MSRNTKTNSELELEEQNGYEACQGPLKSIYASRYNVPQQQVLQRPSRNLKTGSLEGNSHLDSTYAALNIPGPHIYGTGKAQESVYKLLQDPEVSGNTKTNSELELEEQNCYEACKEPLTSIYASRYEAPQQQVLQRPSCNQKTISSG